MKTIVLKVSKIAHIFVIYDWPVHCSAINILRSVAKIIIEVCETNNKESKSLQKHYNKKK